MLFIYLPVSGKMKERKQTIVSIYSFLDSKCKCLTMFATGNNYLNLPRANQKPSHCHVTWYYPIKTQHLLYSQSSTGDKRLNFTAGKISIIFTSENSASGFYLKAIDGGNIVS